MNKRKIMLALFLSGFSTIGLSSTIANTTGSKNEVMLASRTIKTTNNSSNTTNNNNNSSSTINNNTTSINNNKTTSTSTNNINKNTTNSNNSTVAKSTNTTSSSTVNNTSSTKTTINSSSRNTSVNTTDSSKSSSNSNLTTKEVNSLKNTTLVVDGMKFSGLRTVHLGVSIPNSFIASPGFDQDGFASSVNEDLYNYLTSPENDQSAMDEATYLHGGNPIDTCVYFQSSALRAIGQDVPYSIGYTVYLENWLGENGWTQHTDFQYIQKGDICFAGTYHTFCFMGWKDEAEGIAYVMGNESFTEPYYRDRDLSGQSPDAYGNDSYYQATSYWTYGKGYTGAITEPDPVRSGGDNAIGTATINASPSLVIQSEANTSSSKIGSVPDGTVVPVIEQQGGWLEIYYDGVTGWIDGSYTDGLDESMGNDNPSSVSVTVTSPVGLWMNESPSATSTQIKCLPDKTVVTVLNYQDGWYQVLDGSTIGWIDGAYTSGEGKDIVTGQTEPFTPTSSTNNYTTKSVSGTVTIDSDGLWINSEPQANDGNLIVVPKGTVLKTTEESSNGWYQVTYNGMTGWVGGAPYSTFTATPSQPSITTKSVNVYLKVTVSALCLNENPEANDGVITTLPKGTVVQATSESSNGWYKVTYDGHTGWIGGSPYSEVVPNPTPTSSPSSTTSTSPNVLGQVEVVADGLYMNSQPEPNDGIITALHSGQVVDYIGESSNGWYHVIYDGKEGWIGGSPYSKVISSTGSSSSNSSTTTNSSPSSSSSIKSTEGYATVDSPVGLWMNEGPSTSSTGMVIIPYNTRLHFAAEENGWYQVSYNGQVGWVDGQYLDQIEAQQGSSQISSLDKSITIASPIGLWMNEEPNATSSKIVAIPYNVELTATAYSNGWYQVSYDGQTGWVDGAYTN